MRLLRVLPLEELIIDEYIDAQSAPAYAILSHTWHTGEVQYDHIKRPDEAHSLLGFAKIQQCCRRAIQDGLSHVWIDTCCIDKSSSAELSEAINSMYSWYAQAKVCYVYLSDIKAETIGLDKSFLARSRWFTRGWTLQELIAPCAIKFYSHDWQYLGDRIDLAQILSEITWIDIPILLGIESPSTASIARRMSWASKRETTRVEDTAYSLLGLFSVHMPLLYGEGAQAFTRLQEEIMKISDDQSLFAWTASGEDPNDVTFIPPHDHPVSGLLAASPSQFVLAKDIIPFRSPSPSTFSTTNKGLQITLPLYPIDHTGFSLAILSCRYKSSPEPLGVHLRPLHPYRTTTADEHFARCRHEKALVPVSRSKAAHSALRTIYIRNRPVAPTPTDLDRTHAFFIRTRPRSATGYVLTRAWPPDRWRPQQSLFPAPTRKAALIFDDTSARNSSDRIVVMFRVDFPSPNHSTSLNNTSQSLIPRPPHQYDASPTPTLALHISPGIEVLPTDARALSTHVLTRMTHLATHGTHKTFAELSDGRRVIAEISREIWLGEEMFVVDVEVVGAEEGIFEVEGDHEFITPEVGGV